MAAENTTEAGDSTGSAENVSSSADAPSPTGAWTPLTAGPPKLISILTALGAALILVIAIAVTVLSWPDWGVGGAEDPDPAGEQAAVEPETPAD